MIKTVLIVSNVYPPHIIGGAELIAHYQARELQKAGLGVHVFAGESHTPGVHYAVSRDTYDNIPVERLYLNVHDFSSDLVNFHHSDVESRFDDTLKRIKPDVVHMHNLIGLSAGLASLAARRGIPVLVTLHDHWGFCHRNTVITPDNRLCRDFSRCAQCQPSINGVGDLNLPIRMRNDYLWLQMQYVSAYISPSAYLASAYAKAGFSTDRMHVLWNGVDVARFARIKKRPSNRLRFTFIGYLGDHKGLMVLFEALKRIPPDAPLQINVVGDGHLRSPLEKYVTEAGLTEQVLFWGKVTHDSIERVFEQTDVQVMPSIWPENQPVSITEAMASRTAVIASDIGGIPELVAHGHTGFLFEPGNAAQLAERMLRLIHQPALVQEFGANGFARIQDSSLKRQAARLLDLYRHATPVRHVTPCRSLIVCCGPRFDHRAYLAVEEISSRFGLQDHAFVMQQWIQPEQVVTAKAALVLPGAPFEEVLRLTRQKVPIVVPADRPELVDLCLQEQCGLYYETSEEAAECLVWLLEHSDEPLLRRTNADAASGGSR